MPQILQQASYAPESTDQLARMGLSVETIEQSITAGLTQYIKASPLHPITHGGVTAWGEIVATLRDNLISQSLGWSHINEAGLAITHNSNLNISLLVTSGDFLTGKDISGELPSTKNKKGTSIRDIVNRNQTIDMFDEINDDSIYSLSKPVDQTQTWVLLYHIDKQIKEVRFELSLPASTSVIFGTKNKLRIDSWKDRIIFDPIPFVEPLKASNRRKLEESEDISFDIVKKT